MAEIETSLMEGEDLYLNFSEQYDYDQGELSGDINYAGFLFLSYMPVACVVGLTGNCMVWILIRSNQIFRRFSSVFLISLLVFWIGQVKRHFKDPHEKLYDLTCKITTFVAHFCDFTSVWLIVFIGFERLTLLYKATFQRSLVNSRRQVAILVLITFLCNVWILVVAESSENGHCDINVEYERIYNIFSLLETALCMIIPSVFITLSNVLVIMKLRSHFKRIPASPSVSFNTNDVVYSSGPTQTIRSTKISKATLYRLSSRLSMGRLENPESAALRYKRCSLRYADLQLTKSLVIVTTSFLCLNLPNYVYRIMEQAHIAEHSIFMQRVNLFSVTLLYTHHAILFFLYIFNSPQMRKRLLPTALKLLECYCLKTVHDASDQALNY